MHLELNDTGVSSSSDALALQRHSAAGGD